jgi:Cu(I)/Ag(I) efflux system membrane fusion protein
MNNQQRLLLIAAVVLLIGLGGGYLIAQLIGEPSPTHGDGERKALFYRNPMNPAITSPVAAKDEMGMDYIPVYAEEEKKALFYRNPMNPAITSPVPAKDEMGMDYIPVYADGDTGASAPGTVKIDPAMVQNIGVRTAKAEKQVLSRHIRTIGRIDYDEERLAKIYPKTDGWIEKLFINKTGEKVHKDSILLEFYSPQLVASQEEYLLALKNRATLKESPFEEIRAGAESLVESSRERLVLLDVPAHQIKNLEETRKASKTLHIHSPFDGVVTNIGARAGQYVTPQTELYRIADLNRVWVYVDVYEDDLAWVREGDMADMQLTALPGRTLKGRVATIYPYLEAKTRTARVRLEYRNRDGALKPDMYANIVLHASRQVDAIVVPTEAVVRSGSREIVFVVQGAGKYAPREVKLGVSADGKTQIIQGITPGEEVLVSAQFLIDSESKLREAVQKMLNQGGQKPEIPAAPAANKPAAGAAGHQH